MSINEQFAECLHRGDVKLARELARLLPSPKTPARMAAEDRGAKRLAELRAKIPQKK